MGTVRCYTGWKEHNVRKSGLIALIVIAVLTVAAGVYWYMEFMPLADRASTQQTEAPTTPATEQVAVHAEHDAVVAPPIRTSSPTAFDSLDEEPIGIDASEADPIVDESEADPIVDESEADPIVDESEAEPIVDVSEAEPMMVDEIEAEPMADESEAKLPSAAVEVPYTEVEVTVIPFSELEEIIGSELFALAQPLDIDLTLLKAKPEEPVVADLPLPPPVEEEEVEPIEIERSLPPLVEDEEIEPIVVEEERGSDVPLDEPTETMPVIASEALPIPTTRSDREIKEQFWNAEFRVSAISLALPSFKGESFGFELGILHRHGELFSWGGGLAGGKNATDWMLDIVGSARLTFAPQATFSYPLTISLGPSALFSSTPAFGLVARVSGGVTVKLIDSFSLFYEVGLSGRWYAGDDISFAFEPARIGISYSW